MTADGFAPWSKSIGAYSSNPEIPEKDGDLGLAVWKDTLVMEDPEYIQLLVNPDKKLIAIRKSISKDHLAHRISLDNLSGNCYELYSRELLNNLMKVESSLEWNQSYRIYGFLDSKAGVAQFRMNDCQLLEAVNENG